MIVREKRCSAASQVYNGPSAALNETASAISRRVSAIPSGSAFARCTRGRLSIRECLDDFSILSSPRLRLSIGRLSCSGIAASVQGRSPFARTRLSRSLVSLLLERPRMRRSKSRRFAIPAQLIALLFDPPEALAESGVKTQMFTHMEIDDDLYNEKKISLLPSTQSQKQN